jgi:hypothetical protein
MASAVDFQLRVIQSKSLVTSCWKKTFVKVWRSRSCFRKESIGVTTANTWQELSFDFTG